jgi:ubiquinone/menaquinone biosynthesis C-methylase UbiE
VDGIDLSEAMLAKARARLPVLPDREVQLARANAEALPFPDGRFDAALLILILSVVGDPRAALRETFRVLRPEGRAVVFDKFLAAGAHPPLARRFLNRLVMRPFGTDINRTFESMLPGGVEVVSNEPAGFGGTYRMIVLRKAV